MYEPHQRSRLVIEIVTVPQLGEFKQNGGGTPHAVSVKVNHQSALRGGEAIWVPHTSLRTLYSVKLPNEGVLPVYILRVSQPGGHHMEEGGGVLLCREADRRKHLPSDCGRWMGLQKVSSVL